VHVCDVAPTFVDSPGLSHGANYTGHAITPHLPLLDPRRVADAVVALMDRPRAVTWLGAAAGPGRVAHTLAPQRLAAFMHRATHKALRSAAPAPPTDGNLFIPSRGTAIDGGQRKAQRAAVGRLAVLGALGLALGYWAARRLPVPARPGTPR